ncbi:hypothetical protein F8B43_1901 [Methylorubrum populi]|uniref:Uncharacterized protein n=1 Tax=Methylorubrum populi TaxID=223967 RepID=A0A833N2Y9_9HYPH|nr:hypothetical protein F8B43_1901 [Methylorubrum populi]
MTEVSRHGRTIHVPLVGSGLEGHGQARGGPCAETCRPSPERIGADRPNGVGCYLPRIGENP